MGIVVGSFMVYHGNTPHHNQHPPPPPIVCIVLLLLLLLLLLLCEPCTSTWNIDYIYIFVCTLHKYICGYVCLSIYICCWISLLSVYGFIQYEMQDDFVFGVKLNGFSEGDCLVEQNVRDVIIIVSRSDGLNFINCFLV